MLIHFAKLLVFFLILVPGPCEPEDLIDGIIFAANFLGSTQLLSERNPSKNIRMMQAQEAVGRVKVQGGGLRDHLPYKNHSLHYK